MRCPECEDGWRMDDNGDGTHHRVHCDECNGTGLACPPLPGASPAGLIDCPNVDCANRLHTPPANMGQTCPLCGWAVVADGQRQLTAVHPQATRGATDPDEPEEIALAEMSVLTIKPGDKVLFSYQRDLSPGEIGYLTQRWSEWLPGADIKVTGGGTTVGVLRMS